MNDTRKRYPECHMECVEEGDDLALYLVFDGRRIAVRGKPGTSQARTWVPLEPGFEIFDNADRDGLTISFNGATLQ